MPKAKKTKKASAAPKRLAHDPARGIHPDTNRPRLEEIKVLTPTNSPSRIGFGGPGGTNPPSPGPHRAKRSPAAGSAETHPLSEGGPAADTAMGAEKPKKAVRKSSAKKAAKKKAKAKKPAKPATTV